LVSHAKILARGLVYTISNLTKEITHDVPTID
jgi:hypothetical protein